MQDVAYPQRGAAGARKSGSLVKINAAARKLFVTKGYHATRSQDIAREAGLGHGTFYLHYADKRACFLAFVEEARQELDLHMATVRNPSQSLKEMIGATLTAIYDYSDNHPGVLRAAMTEEAVIGAEGGEDLSLLTLWGWEWAEIVREAIASGRASGGYDPAIVGQAIAGAIHQAGKVSAGKKQCRTALVENLTRFLSKPLEPQ